MLSEVEDVRLQGPALALRVCLRFVERAGVLHYEEKFGKPYMSHSLNSLKGIIWGTTIGVIKGDTRSLDYSSYTLSKIGSRPKTCTFP